MRVTVWKAAMIALILAVVLALLLLEMRASQALAQGRAGEDLVTRGQYLVTIMDCGGCHTDGALTGKPDPARHLAGSTVGFGMPEAGIVYPPNLTPDPETGLGRWSDAEIVRAFRRGQSRDGRPLVPIMPWPSYSVLTEADSQAIVAYLRSLPPVRHQAPARVQAGVKAPAPYLTVVRPQ